MSTVIRLPYVRGYDTSTLNRLIGRDERLRRRDTIRNGENVDTERTCVHEDEEIHSTSPESGFDRVDSRRWVCWCSRCSYLLVLGLSLLALTAWLVHLPSLAALGNAWKPMAPSTAVLLVLLAISGLAHASPRTRPARSKASRGIAIGCSFAALFLLIFSLVSAQWHIETLSVAYVDSLGNTSCACT